MTLEKTIPPVAFTEDTFIPYSPSEKKKYCTLPHSPKPQESFGYSKLIKDGLNSSRHRALNRTASDNTFATSPFTNGVLRNAWASTDSVNYTKDRNSKNKCEVRNNVRMRNGQCQTNKYERIVRSSSLKIYTDSDSKKNLSSPTTSAERNSRAFPEDSTTSQRGSCSREILLEFPNSGHKSCDRSSHSSAAKRSEKNKELKSDPTSRRLQPARSLSGLTDSSLKDSRSRSADAKLVECKSRSFFQLFRRKKKTNDDRSPSPVTKSNSQQSSSSNTVTRSPCKVDSLVSQSDKDRRQSGQSLASSRLPLTSSSSNSPQTPSSPPSINSPTLSTLSTSPANKDRLPQYASRSRSKHTKEQKNTRPLITDPYDHVRHEDLPPHPSLYKKTVEKTNSFPYTQYLKYNTISSSSNNNNNIKMNSRNSPVSSRRRNSMPETSGQEETAVVRSPSGMNLKALKGETSQNLRQKLVESSSKAEDNSRVTTSNGEHQQTTSNCDGIRYLPNTDIRVISDPEDFEFSPTDMSGPLNLSLCGCGFLGMYHLGVVSCLASRGASFLDRVERVGGASAGALMAAVLVTCRDKIEETAEHIQNLAREIRKKPLGPLTPGYNFTRSLRYMLEDILPEDAHETAQGKLFVSLTNADTKKNEILSEFDTRDELVEALVASCYIPVYAGIKTPTVRGKKYTDGGLSDSLPRFEMQRTITVSPFDGKSDIGPKVGQEVEKKAHFINLYNQDIQVTVNNIKKGAHAFFPPKPQTLQEYFEKGRYDASRFLIREGLYEITAPPQKKTVLYESSV